MILASPVRRCLLALVVCGVVTPAAAQTRRIERVAKGPEAKPSGGARWAVIVGIDQYQAKDIEALGGAVADAKAIRDVLIKQAEFAPAQVTLLVSDGDVKPTAGVIMDKLDEIKGAAKPEDLLLFFFAGHGVQVDGQRYLLTYESNISSTGRLKTSSLAATALMQELESVRVGHRVLMIDACRNDPTRPGGKPNLADEAFEAAFTLTPTSESGVRATFLSCSKGQSAYEWAEKRRGFFSFYIERGLLGEAAQFGKVTVTSLLTYLNEMVPQKVREQKNQLQVPYAKVDGSELVLVRSDKLPTTNASLDAKPVAAATRTLYGVVKDSAGVPLPGVTMTVVLAGAGGRAVGKPAAGQELKASTDEDGFFKIEGVPPDLEAQVTATKDSYLARTTTATPAEAGRKMVVFLPRVEAPKPVVVAQATPKALPTAVPTAIPTPTPPPATVPATTLAARPTAAPPTTLAARPTATPKPPPTTLAPTPPPTPVPTPPPQPKGSELAAIAYRTFLAEHFKEAEAAAGQALQVEPGNALANAVLGNAMVALGLFYGDAQKTAAGKLAIDKALARDPGLALAHNARGLALMGDGKAGEALAEFQKAIQGDPRLAVAHANLATVLGQQKRNDEAQREFREAIRLEPESAVPYNGLSALFFNMGKYKDAVKAAREAISRYELRDRALGLLYVQLAIASFQQGNQNEAREAVGRAKALGVADHESYAVIETGKPAKKSR